MATERWLSSLANIETRLRRSLGLAGPVGTRIEQPAIVQPVILVDDATRPGATIGAGTRGRRWSAHREFQDLDDTITSYCIQTDSPTGVWVEGFNWSWSSTPLGHNHAYVNFIPTEALLPTYMSAKTRGPRWREAPLGINDHAPLWEEEGTEFPAGGTWPVWNATLGVGAPVLDPPIGATVYVEKQLDLFLAQDQALIFYFGEDDFTGEHFINVYGRVF